jgi:hypothetical protein
MPAELPTEPAKKREVLDFGIGPYDRNIDQKQGEDEEEQDIKKTSIPSPPESTYNDYETPYLSYANSKLPTDEKNPLARSDYYDPKTGKDIFRPSTDDIWPSSSVETAKNKDESELPGVLKNDSTMDNYLQSLGNWWSGYIIEDLVSPMGFPSMDFNENVDYEKINDPGHGGHMTASINFDQFRVAAESLRGRRLLSTNLELVGKLTSEFLKEFGKKDLTRRHVLAFLSKRNHPQYLASDIIRCLAHREDIYIKDVMDEFPIKKEASFEPRNLLSQTRDKIIELEIKHLIDLDTASCLRRIAADLAHLIISVEKFEKN